MKAVIFDMDGTVVDTTALEYEAWKRMLDEVNVVFPYEDYIQALGAKGSEIIKARYKADKSKIETMLHKKEVYFKELVSKKGLQLMPDIEKILEEVKGLNLKMALATGASHAKVDFVMQQFNIGHYFQVFVTADDVKKGKPDPEIFLKAAEKLGVPPQECVVMEDASNGVEAARNAGMACIAITSTRGKNQLQEADLTVDSYKQLSIKEFLLRQAAQK